MDLFHRTFFVTRQKTFFHISQYSNNKYIFFPLCNECIGKTLWLALPPISLIWNRFILRLEATWKHLSMRTMFLAFLLFQSPINKVSCEKKSPLKICFSLASFISIFNLFRLQKEKKQRKMVTLKKPVIQFKNHGEGAVN